jgi:hypothetical protein
MLQFIFQQEARRPNRISEIDAPPLAEESKKRWCYFIRKVYETNPQCQGETRIISFVDQPDAASYRNWEANVQPCL